MRGRVDAVGATPPAEGCPRRRLSSSSASRRARCPTSDSKSSFASTYNTPFQVARTLGRSGLGLRAVCASAIRFLKNMNSGQARGNVSTLLYDDTPSRLRMQAPILYLGHGARTCILLRTVGCCVSLDPLCSTIFGQSVGTSPTLDLRHPLEVPCVQRLTSISARQSSRASHPPRPLARLGRRPGDALHSIADLQLQVSGLQYGP